MSEPMLQKWDQFSEAMRKHIGGTGKSKYDTPHGNMSDFLPWVWAVSDAFKYIWEVLRWHESENYDSEAITKNLMKAAHCCQIAASKIDPGDQA